jgi:16S rRNA C1402 (ribose-2'-O) methylase RsmI
MQWAIPSCTGAREQRITIDMLSYILIGLTLSLFGLAGLQFFYLNYLERIDRSRKNHLRELEHDRKYLEQRLAEAENRIAEQDRILEQRLEEEESWAEVIDER